MPISLSNFSLLFPSCLSPYLHLQIPAKLKILIFKNEPLKHLSTINNSPNLPNQPKLTFTYPPSVSSLPPPQPQPSTSPLKQSSFHHYPPSQNSLRIFQWNANGICPRRTELIQFLSLNKYNLIFLQESLLSSDFTFHVLGYKTLKKNCSMTRRGTTDSTENLGNLTYPPSPPNIFPPLIQALLI